MMVTRVTRPVQRHLVPHGSVNPVYFKRIATAVASKRVRCVSFIDGQFIPCFAARATDIPRPGDASMLGKDELFLNEVVVKHAVLLLSQ